MPTIIAIVIAVIAVAVAIGAWFRPMPKPDTPAAKTYSEQEVADAKKAVCDAFDRGQQTLSVTGSKVSTNPTDSFAIALNSRITINSVIAYWRATLERQPATASDLTNNIKSLIDLYQDILFTVLADGIKTDLDGLYASVDDLVPKVTQACK
ncbi:hypothetical protein [Mycolicibacterium sarraceniae]|uniref:hypothetical protein n=1 Tax=Mycolicibacterium sarraceniae TaxID=1534348 RepID=UPI0013D23D69|nr:hypothetical protein [Mycolicibacterium sarraceniae]